MADRDEVVAVLERAHDVMLMNGWGQWQMVDTDGHVCSLGAIAIGAEHKEVHGKGYPWSGPALAATYAFADMLGLRGPSRVETLLAVQNWNDLKAESIDEPLDAFRKAAKAVANGEVEV